MDYQQWSIDLFTIKKIILFVLCCQFCTNITAQNGMDWRVGVSATFGSEIKRVGISASVFAYHNFAQINLEPAVHYAWNGWGPDAARWEGKVVIGTLGAWGKHAARYGNPFIQNLYNQTNKPNSVGYSYNFYFDNIGMSQTTGAFFFGIRNGRFMFENDMFAWAGQDKFRTAQISLEYRYKNTLFTVRNFLWTGDPEYDIRPPIADENYPSKFGYYDLTKCKYCDHSHGILALQVRQYLAFNQSIYASFGIDSEKVRHATQNKLIHDMPIYGMEWLMEDNPHIPMLDINNEPYLFKEGQEIKPFKWFWEIGL